MTIDVGQLPAPSSISHQGIRSAVSNVELAKHELDEQRKTLVQLTNYDLDAAHEQDAQADADLREKGEKLKGRPATVKAEKAIADTTHEVLVAEKSLQRARQALEITLDQHGAAFVEEQTELVEKLDVAWDTMAPALAKLAAERSAAVNALTRLGGDHPAVSMIQLGLRDLGGIEIPSGGNKVADVFVQTVLEQLTTLGKPVEPEPEIERLTKTPYRNPSPVESHGGWEAEKQREREEHELLKQSREREAA